MSTLKAFKLSGLNLKISPLALNDPGQVIYALNVKRDLIGGYKKRQGYTTLLGTADGSQVNSLFSWTQNNGTILNLYRASGSILYHSVQGTGAWTTSAGGTITAGAHFGHTVLNDTLIGGDGTAASRHTTNGTGFTINTSAPLAELWASYQDRVWGAKGTAFSGTAADMAYSTTGTATDWTTDSDTVRVSGAGRINSLFVAGDRLTPSLEQGNIFKYDGFQMRNLSTNMAPSSPYSIGNIEDFRIYLNRKGVFGYSGGKPEILSNPIERLIYNDSGSAIAGNTFDNAPGISYRYDWLCSVGTITDDLIHETIPDAVLKYDVQLDEWVTWRFADRPTAFGTYQDTNGDEQLMFGDSAGQCYQLAGTATSDDGSAIESGLIGFIHGGSLDEKEWKYIKGLFNPGCKAKVSFALSDTFSPRTLQWKDIAFAKDGVVEEHFPAGSRSIFLFWRIYESSTDQPWECHGFQYEANLIKHD